MTGNTLAAVMPTVLLLAGLALPAQAQSPMTAEEFNAYVTGKTLFFAQDGVPYGVEQYMDDRRVRWSFLDGECVDGTWYAQGTEICFQYEGRDSPQCWEFFLDDSGLSARIAGDTGGRFLYEAFQGEEPMICTGPRIGV